MPYSPSSPAHRSPAFPWSQAAQAAAWLQPLTQQGHQNAGQHISAAANGHSGVSGRIPILPDAVGDAGPVALQQHNAAAFQSSRPGRGHTVLPHRAEQPGKLPVMGRQDGGRLSSAQYIHMRDKQRYAVGVHHHRAGGVGQHGFQDRKAPLPQTQPRTDEHRVHSGNLFQDLRHRRLGQSAPLFRQGEDHRLIELHCLNGIDTLRHTQVNKTRAGAQGSHGGEIGSPCIAPAAAEQQDAAEISFVGIFVPFGQQAGNVRGG